MLEKPGIIKLKEIPMWDLDVFDDSDMVLIKVESCGICGSDLRYFKGENPWAQHTLGRYISTPPNVILGHEFAGEVVSVISERNENLLGKRVAPITFTVCGRCIYCRTGRENMCPNTTHMGHGQGWKKMDYIPGGYAEYVPVWGRGCMEIPGNLSFDEASMMDILTVCTHSATQGKVRKGFPVFVIGCGPAGNGIAQIANLLGASKIIVAGRSEITLKIARKQGFSTIIDVKNKDNDTLMERIMEETNGSGCASVFDTVGSQSTMDLGLSVLDKGGTFVNMAVHNETREIGRLALSSERKITTSCNVKLDEYHTTLSWLSENKIDVKNWFSKVKLEEVPSVFKIMQNREKGRHFFKVVVNP